MSLKAFLRPGTDDLLRIAGLKRIDVTPNTFINDATVTAVVLDSAGVAVVGAESITLSYVASSDGVYDGQKADTAAIVDGDDYTVEVTVIASVGKSVLSATLAVVGPLDATLEIL